ncbi:MAG: SNF2 helicase associated domain-containing protein, partial [Clostridiales bacterium]|nr:SNF2 helicase associated domain-containing protein [Clostridiales bacterium]
MLDWDSLYSEASARAMSGGKKRFYDNRVSGLSSENEGGKTAVYATVKGDRDYKTKILFDEQGGLYDYSCDCEGFQTTDGPCRHIVASALAYENKYPSSPVESGVKTQRSDTGVHALIERFGKQRRSKRIAEESDKVKLQPCIMIGTNGRISLKFTVGSKKMYTLKNVSDFVSCFNTGAEKRYGVELTVVHVPEAFDELSGKIAKFICGCWREKTEFLQDAGTEQWSYRDELPLSAGSVDEFMHLYAGQLVPCDAHAAQDSVRLIVPQENALSPQFKLEKASGGYVLTSAVLRPQVVFGKAYKYLFTDSRIFTVTDAYFDAVLPLIKTIETRGRLFIAEADMPQFYNSVLSRVIPFAEVEAPDIDLSVFEAAPLELKVYLNAGLGGGIEAKLFASYDGETNVNILDDNTPTPYVRDYEGEHAFIAVLKKYFPYYPDLSVDAEEDVYALLRSGLREMMGSAEVYLSEELKRMKVKKPPRMRVGVRLKSDLLLLDLSAEGYDTAELKAVLDAYRNKQSYVRLTDGSFVDLVDSSIAALSDIAEVAKIEGDELTLPSYYAPYVDSELKNAFFVLERSDGFKKMIADLAGAHDSLTEVPVSLREVMRNYQKAGFRWLKALTKLGYGGILADDMGLGKSLQIIALLLSERKGTSIIVCPTTLVLNWVNELGKFAPELKVLAVSGSGELRKSLVEEFPQYDVVITSYELLRRDVEAYKTFDFSFVVIDEAQYIKNHETKNAHAVKQLKAEHRFALTGTPVENSLSELWSIFDFLMPGYLFSYPHFRDTLEAEIVRGNEAAAQRLSRLIKPFILRRLKSGVLKELPPKMESEVLC